MSHLGTTHVLPMINTMELARAARGQRKFGARWKGYIKRAKSRKLKFKEATAEQLATIRQSVALKRKKATQKQWMALGVSLIICSVILWGVAQAGPFLLEQYNAEVMQLVNG